MKTVSLFILFMALSLFSVLKPSNGSKAAEPSRIPIAEFEGVDSVLVSEFLMEYPEGSELIAKLMDSQIEVGMLVNQIPDDNGQAIQESLGITTEQQLRLIPFAHESIWIRDYLGIQTRSQILGQATKTTVDFSYREDMQMEDQGSHQLALTFPQTVVVVPLAYDGGNFLTNGSDCFIGIESSFLVLDNQQSLLEQALTEEVGCRRIHLFKDPPHEHVDMYLKVVNKDHLLVAQLAPEILSISDQLDPETSDYLAKLATKMDRVAQQLKPEFTITRIPLPIFSFEPFNTYVNSVLIGKNIFVPRYSFPDHMADFGLNESVMTKIENRVENILTQLDLKVSWIHTQELMDGGGNFHCVTYQVHSSPSLKQNTTLEAK